MPKARFQTRKVISEEPEWSKNNYLRERKPERSKNNYLRDRKPETKRNILLVYILYYNCSEKKNTWFEALQRHYITLYKLIHKNIIHTFIFSKRELRGKKEEGGSKIRNRLNNIRSQIINCIIMKFRWIPFYPILSCECE